MDASIFQEFLNQVWPKLNLYINEKENGSSRTRTYLHKQRLTPVFSVDQKWSGTSANTRYVAADIVALDSPLPIKKRNAVSRSNGDLPKIGLERKMSETDINTINVMRAQLNSLPEGSETRREKMLQILAKLTNDGEFCSVGIDERNEYNYLYGISNGVVLVSGDQSDPSNTGLGLRVNFGYPESNVFGVQKNGEVCSDDIDNVIAKADAKGVTPAVAMISKSLLDRLRKTQWARQLSADYKEQVYVDPNRLPVPTVKTFTEAFESEYGCPLMVIDRSVMTEKNGIDTPVKPFNQNRIVFLPDANTDGSLVWSELAEKTNPVNGVNYTNIENYKLVSRYRVTDPTFAEVTKGQALVLPVIENVESIFILDCSKSVELAASDATEAGSVDAKITIGDKTYTKSAVLTALKNLGVSVHANAKDETVIKRINELSEADYKALIEAIASYTTT